MTQYQSLKPTLWDRLSKSTYGLPSFERSDLWGAAIVSTMRLEFDPLRLL